MQSDAALIDALTLLQERFTAERGAAELLPARGVTEIAWTALDLYTHENEQHSLRYTRVEFAVLHQHRIKTHVPKQGVMQELFVRRTRLS